MKPMSTLGVFTLAAGVLLCLFAIVAGQVQREPAAVAVVAVSAVAVRVCGVVPVILVAYSDGTVKQFEHPFEGMPPDLPEQWESAITVSSCTGKVELEALSAGVM